MNLTRKKIITEKNKLHLPSEIFVNGKYKKSIRISRYEPR